MINLIDLVQSVNNAKVALTLKGLLIKNLRFFPCGWAHPYAQKPGSTNPLAHFLL